MKKYFILFFIIITINIYGQYSVDHDKAHRRYWYYRTRLINDFMKIGKNQGESVVLSERNYSQSFPSYTSKVGPDQIDITNQYIMALALEYKLLTRANQDVSETVKEIYNLLYTINRLDLEAEQFYDNLPAGTITSNIQSNGVLNGFYVEGRCGEIFITGNNEKHFNYSLKEYPNNLNTSYCGLDYTHEIVDGNFSTHFLPDVNHIPNSQPALITEMSLPQDKYHTMLLAMMFIKKYIPASVVYSENNTVQSFQDGATSIANEASNIANRIYNYCNGPNNLWKLKFLNSQGNDQGNLTDGQGGDAWIYAWPLSRMACMANNSFPWSNINTSLCFNGYNDVYSTTVGYGTYVTGALTPQPCFEDNAVFKTWDHAGSNSNIGLLPIWSVMQTNTGANNLEWSELLRKVLHQNGTLLRSLNIYAPVVDQAPCKGPYNYGGCAHGGFQWSSQDRLEHPDARGAACNGNVQSPIPCASQLPTLGGFYGNYPGVDYMLLHNLFYEYQNQLFEGNNGNTGGNSSGAIFNNIVTWVFNSGSNVGNQVATTACNIANTISGWFNGGTVCSGSNNGGNGGSGSNYSPVPYIPYNLMDNADHNVWPREILTGFSNTIPHSPIFQIQGINTMPSKVAVYQNLISNSHIYATVSPAALYNTIPSNVVYRAGKDITLTDGFQVDAGSTFHAYVLRYICNSNNSDPLNMRQINPDINGNIVDLNHYETDTVNQLPIHYVEHPKSDSDINPMVNEESNNNNSFLTDQEVKELVQQQLVEKQLADQGIYNTNKNLDQRFLITPNPNNGVFTVYVNKIADDEVFSISIHDMKGAEIESLKNVSANLVEQINLTKYDKGIYLVKLFSNKGFNAIKKISVN